MKAKREQLFSIISSLSDLIAVTTCVLLFVTGCMAEHERTGRSGDALPEADGLTYEIIDRETYDAPIKTQVGLKVVVSGTITEASLRQLLEKLYAETMNTREFRHHGGKPTNVGIWIYSSKAHANSGTAQWIAMLGKFGTNADKNVTVRTDLISTLNDPPQVRHGLSEGQRREIYAAIVRAEDRAGKEAEAMYPLPEIMSPTYSRENARVQMQREAEARQQLMQQYRAEVARRYGITNDVEKQIGLEGLEKNWPMPPRAPE